MTWPLLPNLRTAVADPIDPFLNSWILHWDQWATIHRPLALFHPPVFHPARYALAFSEHLWAVAMLTLPLYLAGVGPIAVHGVAMLIGFALSGYGAWVLARIMTGSTAGSLVAGVFFAFVPFRFNHLSHLQHVWSGTLPLLLAALIVLLRRPSVRTSLIFALAFVFNGLVNLHWLFFGAVTVLLTTALLVIAWDRVGDRSLWRYFAGGLIAGVVPLIPFLIPYQAASALYGLESRGGETLHYSAHLSDWLVAPARSRFWAALTNDGSIDPERWLFPGAVVLLLSLLALIAARREDLPAEERWVDRRNGRMRAAPAWLLDTSLAVTAAAWVVSLVATRPVVLFSSGRQLVFLPDPSTIFMVLLALATVRLSCAYPWNEDESLADTFRRSRLPPAAWCFLLWVGIGVVGSLGLNGFFHRFLFEWFSPFHSMRVPARWSIIAYLGLSMLAAVGTIVTIRGRSLPARALMTSTIAAVLLLELHAAPIRYFLADTNPAPVDLWLSSHPVAAPVLELPIAAGGSEYESMFRQTMHGMPILNGVSGFSPPEHDRLIAMAHSDPIPPSFINRLERNGCGLVLVHADRLPRRPDALRRWLKQELSAGRLAFVRRFGRGLFGDYVFAVTAVVPAARGWRAPQRMTQHLVQFLTEDAPIDPAGQPVGFLERPAATLVRGPQTFSGWVAVPEGVASIDLRFANGREVIPAALSERPDLERILPGYGRNGFAGFSAEMKRRPPGGRDTDVQLEIVTSRGRHIRLDDRWLTWMERGEFLPGEWDTEALGRLLGRIGVDPDLWSRSILGGVLEIEDAAAIIISDDRDLSDRSFVIDAFRKLLGRPPDPAALSQYLESLRSRDSNRRAVVRSLLRGGEFEAKHLRRAE